MSGGQNEPPSLDGPMAKVERANFHYTQVVEAWHDIIGDSGTYSYSVEIEDDGRKHTYGAVKFPTVDPAWGLVLGDAVHNLRSALDHLAWQLVRANGAKPSRATQFPIHGEAGGVRIAGGVDPDALALIEQVQPYHGRDEGENLRLINALDIMDKHRYLIVTAMAVGSWTRVDMSSGNVKIPPDAPYDSSVPDIIDQGRPDPTSGVKAGDIVAWFTYAAPLPNPDPNFDLLPDITFVEGPLAGKSVMEILVPLRWVQYALLPRFARFF